MRESRPRATRHFSFIHKHPEHGHDTPPAYTPALLQRFFLKHNTKDEVLAPEVRGFGQKFLPLLARTLLLIASSPFSLHRAEDDPSSITNSACRSADRISELARRSPYRTSPPCGMRSEPWYLISYSFVVSQEKPLKIPIITATMALKSTN